MPASEHLSPYELWVQAGGESEADADVERYHELLHEAGMLLMPGDPGYEQAGGDLPCGWRPGDRPA